LTVSSVGTPSKNFRVPIGVSAESGVLIDFSSSLLTSAAANWPIERTRAKARIAVVVGFVML